MRACKQCDKSLTREQRKRGNMFCSQRCSGDSRVMTLEQKVSAIYANTKPEGGCLVTTRSRYPNGYACGDWRGRGTPAHRIVAEFYLGPCPDGMEVGHRCGRGTAGCVTASHLHYTTRQDNLADRDRRGATTHGERHHASKLSAAKVRDIRARVAAGEHGADLAREYGVAHSVITMVHQRKTWKRVV